MHALKAAALKNVKGDLSSVQEALKNSHQINNSTADGRKTNKGFYGTVQEISNLHKKQKKAEEEKEIERKLQEEQALLEQQRIEAEAAKIEESKKIKINEIQSKLLYGNR